MANALQRLTTGNLLAKFIDGEWVLMKECCCEVSSSTSSSSSSSSFDSSSSESSDVCCSSYTLVGFSVGPYNGLYEESGVINGRPAFTHTSGVVFIDWRPSYDRWFLHTALVDYAWSVDTGLDCPEGQLWNITESKTDGWVYCDPPSSSSSSTND